MRLVSLLLATTLLFGNAAQGADPVTPTQCGPADSGTPCDGTGPASQGNSSGTNQGAGNPINVITGNKYQQETDLPALPGVLGLEIVRHYNSALASTPPGILGRGWRLSYETEVYPVGNTLQVMQADGTRILFIRDPKNPGQCASNNPAHGRLAITRTARGEEYVWTWTNGRTLSFNHLGKLIHIKAPTGEFVTLTRDPAGLLMKVTDPQGRSLVFGYPARSAGRFNGVAFIDSPVGRFTYTYGSVAPQGYAGNPRELLANLAGVTLPGGVRRQYHYEDAARPAFLTGISVADKDGKPQRIATWAYDSQGRGILSIRGWPKRLGQDGKPVPGTGIEQVELSYTPGKTLLTNSLGQTTVYTHAIVGNEYRLLEVRGAGCASCGEANVRYGYDALGLLTSETKLGADGRPLATTKTERDTLGRVARESRIDYVNGRAQPARLIARVEYAGQSNAPSLIARPSVVPGKEAVTRIVYNDYGQPLSIAERGFSPLNDKGQVRPTPIARTTTYAYRTINNRSLLLAIDGPLPNGKTNSPAHSDVTRIEWDASGSRVVALTRPGEGADTVAYDEAGRIARVRNAEGFTTVFQYDGRNQLVSMASAGDTWARQGIEPVIESYRYDEFGNRIETGSGGVGRDPYRPRTRRSFDVAGRLLWQAEALGILKYARYDTEGNLLSSTVQTKRFEQTERYRYDALNRLVQVADTTGSERSVVYGDTGDGQRLRSRSAFRILKDDFGRTVSMASASHGSVLRQYDAADQLVQQRTDKGDIQTYAYDLTGQCIRHTIQPQAGEVETITWRYEQRRLVEVSDPVQTERIRYNERGQPETRTVILKLANGAEATHVTRYSYTADGSLRSQSLPDGTRILYEHNGQGQVVAVHQQTSPWTFFGWGKTTLVKDLERDLVGLRHVTYGNGIQGQWQRSREGVLARVVYTRPEGRSANPSRVVAASRAAVRQATLGSILHKFLPAAHAQTPPPQPNKLPGALGIPVDPQALFDARLLYDGAGNVLLQKQQGQGLQHTQAYAYDRQSQLIAAQTAPPAATVKASNASDTSRVWRYHYDRNGNRVLAQENVPVTEMGHTRKASYDLASNAMLTPALDREYVWNARGRLITIRQENRELARYRYNHHGLRVGKQTAAESTHTLYNEARQRIADLDADGRITRQYLWLGDHLIATLDARQPKALQASVDGFWQELTQTARALWSSATGQTDRLAFVHVNHLGAPIAVTDEAGQILWQAEYAPYSALIRAAAAGKGKTAYTLALRLPGQWADAESGLYYNDFRYYDPQSGRYLSPDPLGPLAERLGSPNAYAYVNNNPLSYIDPWGLILFAFDGTGNTKDSRTNVYWFSEHYLDNDPDIEGAEAPYYIEGPGTGSIILPKLDGGIAFTMRSRINQQLDRLDLYVAKKVDNVLNVKGGEISPANPLVITLDIIGFSRGAAAARDFANTVVSRANSGYYRQLDGVNGACVQVKLRFMGLFDTVLSYAVGSFNMGVPEAVEYVSQAVAVNEHRHDFPLESIEPSYTARGLSSNRTERGFVGAHSDIGGGYNCTGGAAGGCDGGDLSDVALNWMVSEAKRAGVTVAPLPADLQTISNPILHNETRTTPFKIWGTGQDREVRYPVASDAPNPLPKQRDAPIEGMTYTDSLAWITRDVDPTTSREGMVDMTAYGSWLKANYGINLQ
ncbi:MAG: RHS repeat-associated core domain-containing protein [Pseudomonadota bacterium]